MSTHTLKKVTAYVAIVTNLAAFTLPAAQAAPGTIANAPLNLTTTVEPNIMFLLDDSGSMEWEFLAQGFSDGIPMIGGSDRYYILPSANNGWDQSSLPAFPSTVPSATKVPDAWRARNSSFNVLYYNPAITYEPWDGVNAGVPLYTNAVPTAARVDPNSAAVGTLNLTVNKAFTTDLGSDTVFPAHHYLWTDTNSNGLVDTTDAKTLVEIKPTPLTYAKASTRTDCIIAATTCSYAEEIQNFANWYTYHRKRNYVAKKAIGNLVDKSTSTRMGLHTYNNATVIRNATSMATAANKLALLQSTYNEPMPCVSGNCPGTPARTALERVGVLFEGASSPILSAGLGGTCQQNFTVVMTDGYWNDSYSGVGNTDINGASLFDGPPYADSYSDTLADVAMHYYERDLKNGLADNVPTTPGVDDAKHQHLVTYTVAFGLNGTLNPLTANPTAIGFNWPDPTLGDLQKIDDTWHAAYNGRGKFLSAKNPQDLAQSLSDALLDIEDRSTSSAALAFNSTSLSTNSVVYQAKFNSAKWSGDLLAYPLNSTTGNVSNTANWYAATQVNLQTPTSRIILSYNPTSAVGIPFRWSSTALSATQQADLNTSPAGTADTKGALRLNYLRGDRSNEGTTTSEFRRRSPTTVLGDIVNSAPVYVGKPELQYPDGGRYPAGAGAYSGYKSAQALRTGVVYAGANDGMLHGFDAATGNEVLAYVPHNLFSTTTTQGLHYLSDKSYMHRYYVDLAPTVADAYIKSTPTGGVGWKSVLVGGERGGGRGYFALDVTNPSAFSETSPAPDNIVMWEFSSADDANLGYTFSRPTIALMNNGRWAAVFGNGYYNVTDIIGTGEAQLFIAYLDGGLDGVWTLGTDYLRITTQVGTTAARNGLASPTLVDTNGDQVADRIYAGDLLGNMWAFDVSNALDTNWGVAYKTGATPNPLFTAKDSLGNPQPITVKPEIALHPSVALAPPASGPSNLPNMLVLFGTGQYLANGDISLALTQTFYGVWDNGTKELLRANLVAQTAPIASVRVPTNNVVNYASKNGWYFDLPTSGERVVVNPKVKDGFVHFNTLIPSTVVCSYGGSGWLMTVKLDNGGRPDAALIDYNNDGVVNALDDVSGQSVGGTRVDGVVTETVFLGDKRYVSGVVNSTSTCATCNDGILTGNLRPNRLPTTGRLSWQEMIQ